MTLPSPESNDFFVPSDPRSELRQLLAALRALPFPMAEHGFAKGLYDRLEQLRYEMMETAKQWDDFLSEGDHADDATLIERGGRPPERRRPTNENRTAHRNLPGRRCVGGMPSAASLLQGVREVKPRVTNENLGQASTAPRKFRKSPEAVLAPVSSAPLATTVSDSNLDRPWLQPNEIPVETEASLFEEEERPSETVDLSVAPPVVVPSNPAPKITVPAVAKPSRPQKTVASKPRTVPNPRPARTRTKPATVDRSEISLTVRWWNAPVVLVASFAITVLFAGVAWENVRVTLQEANLDRVLASVTSTPEEIRAAAQSLSSSPLSRGNAQREHLLAQAALRCETQSAELAASGASHHLRRAMKKSPASLWHHLNAARVIPKGNDESNTLWDAISRRTSAEPAIREQLAVHCMATGDREKGMATLRELLNARPERTTAVVKMLIDHEIPLEDALSIVPASPQTLLQLVDLSKQETVIGLRPRIELRLTEIEERATKSGEMSLTAAEWAAMGEVYRGLERIDQAAEAFEKAATLDPHSPSARLRLAQVRFEQRRFEECDRLVRDLMQMPLSPELRTEVQQLVERAKTAMATGPNDSESKRLAPMKAN